MLSHIAGLQVVVSDYCYRQKTVVRGIADARRPNGKKPFYRKVVIRTPVAYRIGNTLVCAPEIVEQIKKHNQQSAAPSEFHLAPWAFNYLHFGSNKIVEPIGGYIHATGV